jgi:1,4-alpha-glucan branching enzyme
MSQSDQLDKRNAQSGIELLSKRRNNMAIRKQFLENKPVCKVTFKIPVEMAHAATQANVVGEFNDWSTTATPMKRSKNGAFSATVELEKGRSYQFRYLLGQSYWENDPDADGYLPTPFGNSTNSVINL